MKPASSTPIGSWGRGRVAGPNVGLAPSGTEKVDWWQGQNNSCVSAWYRPTGQPAWVQILENATTPLTDQSLGPGGVTSSGRRIRSVWESAASSWPSGNTVTTLLRSRSLTWMGTP